MPILTLQAWKGAMGRMKECFDLTERLAGNRGKDAWKQGERYYGAGGEIRSASSS